MLILVERLLNMPILSLQTGAELGRTNGLVIDPRQLKVAALRITGPLLDHNESVLHPEDIREISDIGFIVDNSDKLMSLEGLVRLQQIIDFGFDLIGVRVEDDHKHKLGTVKNFALDPDSFMVQQLYVKPSILRSLSTTILTVHRSQIVSITNEKIVVKAPAVKEESTRQEAVQTTSFVNPFRSPPSPQLDGQQE